MCYNLGSGLLCSKFYLLCFWALLKNQAYYAQNNYCIMLSNQDYARELTALLEYISFLTVVLELVTALLEYLDLISVNNLLINDWLSYIWCNVTYWKWSLNFFQACTFRVLIKFSKIISIMLALFLMLLGTYYALNYASIIGWGLLQSYKVVYTILHD